MLQKIRVLDLGSFITAPYAAMLLAELGAEVVKVERPGGGDPFRAFDGNLYSPQFQAHNRNKKSILLDYGQPAGKNLLLDLIQKADVLIVNMRPGGAERLGIGAEEAMRLNPKLVYCSITGFGEDGPYKDRPAYDTVGQSLSGWLSLFHDSTDPRIAGPAVCDALTGMFACNGVLAALVERSQTGKGRKVDVNMVEANLAFAAEPLAQFFATGKNVSPFGRTALSQSFVLSCSDGARVGVHLSSPEKFWLGLVAATNADQLKVDERFSTREGRVRNYQALSNVLAEIFATKTSHDWHERLKANDVPFAPALRFDELMGNEHVRHLNPFYTLEHPVYGAVQGVRNPLRFDGERCEALLPPPALGEHSSEVLKSWLGLEEPASAKSAASQE